MILEYRFKPSLAATGETCKALRRHAGWNDALGSLWLARVANALEAIVAVAVNLLRTDQSLNLYFPLF